MDWRSIGAGTVQAAAGGAIALVGAAAISGLLGSLFDVERNTANIDGLQRSVQGLHDKIDGQADDLDRIRIVVVSAHPDKASMAVTEAEGTGRLSTDELGVVFTSLEAVAGTMAAEQVQAAFRAGRVELSPRAQEIVHRNDISDEQLGQWAEFILQGSDRPSIQQSPDPSSGRSDTAPSEPSPGDLQPGTESPETQPIPKPGSEMLPELDP